MFMSIRRVLSPSDIGDGVFEFGNIDNSPIGQITPAKGSFTQFNWAKGADVASADALTLGNDGNYFDITGTTTITSIGTLKVGIIVCLHFDDILTLTHNATDLILPSGENITTAVGDEAIFIEYATGKWRCIVYTRADETPGSPFYRDGTTIRQRNSTDATQLPKVESETKTDDYTITTDDLGKSLRMNAATAKTFTFPSVGATEDGARLTISKVGSGKLTLQMVDSDKVHDSSAAGTIYNDQSSEIWATITLEYCDATTTWNIIGAAGTWITT